MIQFTVYGNPVSGKNGRQIGWDRKTGKRTLRLSDAAQAYKKDFLKQITGKLRKGYKEPVAVLAMIYYRNPLSDVEDSLIADLLQEAGVVKNDNFIKLKLLFGMIDKKNPRIDFVIAPMMDVTLTHTGGQYGINKLLEENLQAAKTGGKNARNNRSVGR